MVDISSIYRGGGDYLKGDDLADCDDLNLVISGVEIQEFDSGRKAVLSFEGTDKKLTLNKGNAAMVAEVCHHPDTDKWIGNAITLYGTKVEYQGKLVNGVRVRPPARKPTGKKPAFVKDSENPADGMDDGIPF